jgi:nicotinamidase-related amidase
MSTFELDPHVIALVLIDLQRDVFPRMDHVRKSSEIAEALAS